MTERKQIEALQADNERLREALTRYRKETPLGHQPHMIAHLVDEALAATPEQSLDALTDRIRAEAFAEVADKLEAFRSRLNKVLATKEPE